MLEYLVCEKTIYLENKSAKTTLSTLGQKLTFYPEVTKNFMFEKCEFCEKWDFENVNFVKSEIV